MDKSKLARCSAVWSLSFCLSWASLSEGASTAGNPGKALATDPGLDMVAALQATGPHPSLGSQANVFGRFVGTWDGEIKEFSKNGDASRSSGEWIFGWVMDGRAIQDLFIIHPSASHQAGFVGTSLRYFDPKSETWTVTFVDPEDNSVATLTGGVVGDDRIVVRNQDAEGKETRWSFVDIRADSWVFRDEETRDGGKTWRLREEDHFKRRVAAPHPL